MLGLQWPRWCLWIQKRVNCGFAGHHTGVHAGDGVHAQAVAGTKPQAITGVTGVTGAGDTGHQAKAGTGAGKCGEALPGTRAGDAAGAGGAGGGEGRGESRGEGGAGAGGELWAAFWKGGTILGWITLRQRWGKRRTQAQRK